MRKLFKVLCYDFYDLDSCADGGMKRDYTIRAKLERDCELGEWKFSASNEFPFYTDECVFASRV